MGFVQTGDSGNNRALARNRHVAAVLPVFLALFLTACAGGNNLAPPPPVQVSVDSLPEAAKKAAMGESEDSRAILAAINEYRADHGIPPLSANRELQYAAAVHSADMAQRGFFGHFNPDGQGPGERLKAAWPEFKGSFAENVAVLDNPSPMSSQELADALVKQWIASPPHRKNIRNAAYTLSDIGIARSDERIYVTELFATP
jgi:uncharacterized protein YkwD